MKRALLQLVSLTFALSACNLTPDYAKELSDGINPLIALGPEDEMPDFSMQWKERDEILPALELSLQWTRREHARQFFPQAGITRERAIASLERFREILAETYGPNDFQGALEREFTIYKSAGWDGRGGGVLFTGYCTPILSGSLNESPEFRYPLYALPPDLVKRKDGSIKGWKTAHGMFDSYPSRGAIEAGGLLRNKGLELVWLRDPIDAYLAHVNGSAFIELPTGEMYRLGYAGKNGRPYTSLGKELIADGQLTKGTAGLNAIRDWAATVSESQLQEYLNRNQTYVFFTGISGNPHGSLDVEVTPGRSAATDKTLFPRGAMVFVTANPGEQTDGALTQRFYFDQDTGGAIRTAGRTDLYVGVGPDAERIAGRTKTEGQLYYLFLKE
ncbi:MAG: membrane-bound lytic murein transglycosylase A [Candidatus Paceibacteria bacterium]|jgi:membrane-bound lytic murein transglycosylase A